MSQGLFPYPYDGKIKVGQQHALLEGKGSQNLGWFFDRELAKTFFLQKTPVSDFEMASQGAPWPLIYGFSVKRPLVQGFELFYLTTPSKLVDKAQGHDWEMARVLRTPSRVLKNATLYRDVVVKAFEEGSILSFSWHTSNPFYDKDMYKASAILYQLEHLIWRSSDDTSAQRAYDEYHRQLDILVDFFISLKNSEGALPFIFRPFHEHNGSWFWWTIASKTNHKQREIQYKNLWRYTIHYIRSQAQKKKNPLKMYVAYSPDKADLTDYPNHPPHYGLDGWITSSQEYKFIKHRYMKGYPGDNYVDILGMDLYSQDPKQISELMCFLDHLRIEKKSKQAIALTEMGNIQSSLRKGKGADYFDMLYRTFNKNSCTHHLSYILFWRNSGTSLDKAEEHFVPLSNSGHDVKNSFARFLELPMMKTL